VRLRYGRMLRSVLPVRRRREGVLQEPGLVQHRGPVLRWHGLRRLVHGVVLRGVRATERVRTVIRPLCAVVVAAAIGCGGGASDAGSETTTASQTGCSPGTTPLQPRTLGQGLFSGLDLAEGAVLATGSELQRFPLTGDPAIALTQASGMRGLVVVGQTAYFTADHPVGAPNAEGKQSSTTALYSVPLAGAAATLVLDMPLNIDGAVTDGTAIYFSGYGGGIVRVVVADASQSTLSLPRSLEVNAIALHDGVVYVAATDLGSASPTNGTIVAIPATGGSARTVLTNIGHPWNLVAAASGLYWVEDPPVGVYGDSHIARAGLDGTGVRTLVSDGASALAVDGADLYFANGSIGKVPVAGGAVTTLVPGLKAPGLLIVSGGTAVWVDPASQALSDPTVPSLMTTCW
jgi:hypothetical protein